MTGYSNPFLKSGSTLIGAGGGTVMNDLSSSNQFESQSTGNLFDIHIKSASKIPGHSSTGFEFSPLKRAEARVDQAIETFDFDIFQDIQSDKDNFRVFQRFCLLLLIIHGELERVQQDKSDEFLKQLNVFNEVVSIKQTIAQGKFHANEITALYLDDQISQKNKLQQFINVVVTYSVLKLKGTTESKKSSSF